MLCSTNEPTDLIVFEAANLRDKSTENHDFGIELTSQMAKTLVQRLQGTRMLLIDLYGMRP